MLNILNAKIIENMLENIKNSHHQKINQERKILTDPRIMAELVVNHLLFFVANEYSTTARDKIVETVVTFYVNFDEYSMLSRYLCNNHPILVQKIVNSQRMIIL